ncbi:putative Ig domain-containing protein [Nonomuraea sp. B1E8]|uniref:putative Ig domain-containing protein n=1 Tax=unclassified Nonomuraea TaxID=2593643 RepID=UPI00325E5E9C
MTTTPVFVRRRTPGTEHPVELRFVDMLLTIIATLMVVTIVLSVVSAISGSGQPDVAPSITTRSAPEAIVGRPYRLTLAVEGGDGEYTWRAVGGTLPAGLRLSTDGVIEGTPARKQTSSVSVRVSDGSGRLSEVRELGLSVRPSGAGAVEPLPPRVIGPVTLLDGAVAGRLYTYTFTAGGGRPPYRWSGSALPDGLQLAPDGILAGRPTAGTFTFTVTLTDAGGATARQQVRLVVKEAPDSLFWQVLDWLVTIVTWIGYLLFALTMLTLLLGTPGSGPREGLLTRAIRRFRE